MSLWVKVLAVKPNNRSSTHRAHMREGKKGLQQVVL